MTTHSIPCFLVAVCCTTLACSSPGADVLATCRDSELTISDLDAYVRALPEAQRIAPEGAGREAWTLELVRGLALARVLEESEAVRQRLASTETLARRRWAIAGLLATAVMQDLVQHAATDDDAVQERLSAMALSQPQPRYNFRHIFFRLDRAVDAKEELEARRLAATIERRARQGEDFAELARQYSQSSTAADGGLVQNQRPALLEEAARRAVEALAEGEVSPLVESRTGLHIFRLERKLTPQSPGREQLERQARAVVARATIATARVELLAELRQRFEVATDGFPWRVGSFEVSRADLEPISGVAATGEDESQRGAVVDQLLLAEEGRRRGLLTADLEAQVDLQLRREAVQRVYQERRTELIAAIPEERLRPIFDARPVAFAEPEQAHLDLIFVPQGRDVFATQRRMEDHVARLRSGASFSELARRISTGPGAEQGGDLGLLPPSEWVRLGPEVYKAVVAMEAGGISDPVYQTGRILTTDPRTLRGGFAILRVRGKNPPRERDFEEATSDLRAAYGRQNAAEIDQQARASILDEADFELVRLPAVDELLP